MNNILFRKVNLKKGALTSSSSNCVEETCIIASPFGKADVKASGPCCAIPADVIRKLFCTELE